MLVVRAVTESDLEGMLELAGQSGSGMTTLKPDRKMLGQRLEIACASFAEQIAPTQRDYVFVMEDTRSGRLAGICAIKSAVGLEEPFYNYRIGTLVYSSRELGVFSKMETLCIYYYTPSFLIIIRLRRQPCCRCEFIRILYYFMRINSHLLCKLIHLKASASKAHRLAINLIILRCLQGDVLMLSRTTCCQLSKRLNRI